MSSQIIGILFIGFSACISLLQGLNCARKAMKEGDKVLAVFAVVFNLCGITLLLCLNSITA